MNEPAATVHLSIGEVLSLVQEEFPDVTISKIRFLESQGLIAPERTASGYRKFYDADIDQLRWILRQQRDHFLPLKVIKRMLDQGVDTSADGSQQQLFPSEGAEEGAQEGAGAREPSADEQDRAGDSAQPERSGAHPAVAAAARAPRRRAGETGSGRRHDGEQAAAAGPDAAAASSQRHGHEAAEPAGAEGGPSAPGSSRPVPSTPADIVAALQEDPGGGRRRRRDPGPDAPRRRSMAERPPTAERLSRDELLEAAGIDDELLVGLESFGLVQAVTIGAAATYDAEALEIARLAARYAQLGVEARHLRMYKVAAEREAGFVEQLIVPLVKQRNPTARQQAVERCDELSHLGAELHQALLRRHLGPLLGP